MIPLIIVRPEPGATSTAARAKALGLEPLSYPLFELRALRWTAPDPCNFDAVLITSANAARLGGDALSKLLDLPAFAVGDATADAARSAGFADVRAGAGDGAALVAMAARAEHRRVLHLCGHDHRTLAHPGVAITALKVYDAKPLDPPNALLARLNHRCAVLAHSPRSAARLADLVPHRAHVDVVAISKAAASAAGGGWNSIQYANVPTDDAMLALAHPLCCSKSVTI
jgi:uroporphyrinogen-III synthase